MHPMMRIVGIHLGVFSQTFDTTYLRSNRELSSRGLHGGFNEDIWHKESKIGIRRVRANGSSNFRSKSDRFLSSLRVQFPVSSYKRLSRREKLRRASHHSARGSKGPSCAYERQEEKCGDLHDQTGVLTSEVAMSLFPSTYSG
jgi:hypothetical protein